MKRSNYLYLFGMMCGISLLGGCLFKPARVPTHHFILASIPAPETNSAAAQHLSLEVGFVKMPSYLLRDSMVIRKSATEIEYLENALWAERLDLSFRQTLAENLSLLLPSDLVYLSTSERGQVRVSVDVKQFDVDTQGRGTLIAWWQVTAPGSDKRVKGGQARLTRLGPAPRASPQVIATTLSALTAEFSEELAQAIREEH
jgi:uncharacterized lipoprotein YmbA